MMGYRYCRRERTGANGLQTSPFKVPRRARDEIEAGGRETKLLATKSKLGLRQIALSSTYREKWLQRDFV